MTGYDAEAGRRLWDYIRERMAETGIANVSELARKAGSSRGTLYDWRHGREPDIDAGRRVAEALGVSYRDLMQHRAGLLNGEHHPQPLPEDQIREIAERVAQLVVDRLARSDPERSG
jgi:transcriptional regulator with XRE-family HTH domain